MAKELKKICQGAQKWEGVHWWRELADKRKDTFYQLLCILCVIESIGKSTKVHLYWAMRNSNGSPEDLRHNIMNTSKHYQVCISIMHVISVQHMLHCGRVFTRNVILTHPVKNPTMHHQRLTSQTQRPSQHLRKHCSPLLSIGMLIPIAE